MNITHDKRGPHNRHSHRHHLLTALLVAAMVMLLTVPAFATEAATGTNTPDTEVSTSAPNLTETPTDEADPTPAPISGLVRNFDELQDAIAHANANDVIEITGEIIIFPDSVLGRADCPVTIRRATDDAYLKVGLPMEEISGCKTLHLMVRKFNRHTHLSAPLIQRKLLKNAVLSTAFQKILVP